MTDEPRGINIFALVKRVYLGKTVASKIIIALLLSILLALLFPRGESIEFDYKVGAIWAQNDLIAPFSFPILRDERAYQQDVEEARKNVYDVFERDSAETDRDLSQLKTFFREVREALLLREAYVRDERISAPEASQDSAEFTTAARRLSIPLSERDWETLAGLERSGRLDAFERSLTLVIENYLRAGILDRAKSVLTRPEIALRHGTNEEIIPAMRFFDQGEVVTLLEQALKVEFQNDSQSIDLAYRIAIQNITPNIKYNADETAQAVAAAIDAVPRTAGYVQENERIVSKHERISPEIKLRLDSLRKAKAERGPEGGSPWQFFGTFLHVLMVILLYGIYLQLFRKRIFESNRRLALIGLLILLEGIFAYLTREVDTTAPIEFLIFVPAASMLLTIIFDSRVGFYGTVIIAFVVAGIRGNDYGTGLCAFVAGALAVYTVRDMRYRAQIFRSLGFIFLGYAVSIVALGLERFASFGVIVSQMAYALLNAVISPVLTYGLLIFFERVFKVTTDLTLLELAQFNHPLLRMLAVQAPGTYHHSISMATLAEAASAAVGANEILARVGAYFHDIGKIEKPAYFVENQKTVRSRHDKISPRMSSLIIAAHVKDGIALAREYGLPDEVVEFIPMHHGTTRIDYFYNKALEIARQDPNPSKIDEIKESDYRYPGPKPQTKETGIMMLADAVEAAVRTIEEPTPERIEDTIANLITKRFEEGELNECPLTLKDLTRIRGAFLNVLVGAYHSRVRYPEIEEPRRKSRRRRPDTVPPDASRDETEPDRNSSARF
jgi:putative nucleotidyltransferase with HDIG domain